MPTPREDLAVLLREARKTAGYKSHGALAKVLNVSRSVVAKAESAAQPFPTDQTLASWVEHTGADPDKITELVDRARSGAPEWFMPYATEEAAASVIRCFSPFAVPGLGQTRAYMRDLFHAEGHLVDRVDELTRARLERQAVIGRAHVTMIIGQHALSYLVGSASVMAEQCAHLVILAERGVSLYVLPEHKRMGVGGALAIATRGNVATVCLTTTLEDIPTTAPDMVEKAALAYDRLLGAALPQDESIAFVRTMEEQWKAQI
jgi:hypothetical protein